jgi:hypothetical protein
MEGPVGGDVPVDPGDLPIPGFAIETDTVVALPCIRQTRRCASGGAPEEPPVEGGDADLLERLGPDRGRGLEDMGSGVGTTDEKILVWLLASAYAHLGLGNPGRSMACPCVLDMKTVFEAFPEVSQ